MPPSTLNCTPATPTLSPSFAETTTPRFARRIVRVEQFVLQGRAGRAGESVLDRRRVVLNETAAVVLHPGARRIREGCRRAPAWGAARCRPVVADGPSRTLQLFCHFDQ